KLIKEEIPYGIGVVVTNFRLRDDKPIYDVSADIVCDRKNHKAVIIGKGGSMLKKIATEAREDMEEMLDTKVFLTLYVKADEGWRDNAYLLNELGYGE
ncbi:MAG: KH domain-containing protein, partial [Clostridiales bacterium]|nr:KH domain-containing protein [Clostridiales bacterium]